MLKKLFFIVPIIVMIILSYLLSQPDVVKQSEFINYLITLTMVHVISGIILIVIHIDGFDDKDIFYYYAMWWVYVFTGLQVLLTNHFYPHVLNTTIIATIVKVSLFVVYAVHHYKLLQLFENFLNKMDAKIETKIETFYEFTKIKIEK